MSGRGRGRGRGRGSGPVSQSALLLQRSAQEAGLDTDRQMLSLQEIIRPPLYPDIQWHSSGKPKSVVAAQKAAAAGVKTEADDADNKSSSGVVIAKRPASVVAMIQKQRQIFQAFQSSPHFVQQYPAMDVARYGKQSVRTAPDQHVLLSMSSHNAFMAPPEKEDDDDNDNDSKKGDGPNAKSETTQAPSATIFNKLATDGRYFPAELLSTRRQLESAREARNPQKRTLTDLLEDEPVDDDDEENKEGEEDYDLEVEDLEMEDMEDYTTNYYDSDNDDDGSAGGDGGEATF